jgi:hypothetical protein
MTRLNIRFQTEQNNCYKLSLRHVDILVEFLIELACLSICLYI